MYQIDGIEMTLIVPSVEETAAWYERVLGWIGHYDVFDREGHCLFGSVGFGAAEVEEGAETGGETHFQGFNLARRPSPASSTPVSLPVEAWIRVDKVDEVYARAVAQGVTPESAPQDQLWGERIFTMRDLNGLRLRFTQAVESVTLEEVRRRHQARLEGGGPD